MTKAPRNVKIDPVLTRVIGGFILSAAEEMGSVLVRTSYSTNIKERADCSTAVFDAEGRTVAQASHVPLHLGALLGMVRQVLERFPVETIQPGDMFIANDAFLGIGSQLNDITVAAPVFDGGEIVAYVANIAHHSDVGGRFPGSEAAASETIYEEGLRLPPVRLLRGGTVREDIVSIIQGNSRVPRNVGGDLRAQIAANRIGVRRMQELHVKYGKDEVRRHMSGWLDYAELRIRKAIEQLPVGRYSFSDLIDDDGGHVGDAPLMMRVEITVASGELTFDFTGCPPQGRNSHNAVLMALLATVYYATKAILDPDIPPNAGYYRAIRVIAPEGTIVNAVPPAAVATRNHTCQKVVDVIMGAMASVVPARVVAGCASSKLMIIGGVNPRTGRPFIDYEANSGGLGARASKDGLDVSRAHMTNTGNLPIEALEQEDPLLVERYELVPDSGGPGRYRGGLGARRDTKMLGDGFEQSGFSLGHDYPGVGLLGGSRGRIAAPSMLVRNYGSEGEEHLHPAGHYVLTKGDVLSVFTPGGGGFGDPLDRPLELIANDLEEGKISAAAADSDYGVVLGPDSLIDPRASAEERRRRRLARSGR